MEDEGRQKLVMQMLASAFWAGANAATAIAEPEAAGGLGKLARRHAQQAGTLARELLGETARPITGAASPLHQSRSEAR